MLGFVRVARQLYMGKQPFLAPCAAVQYGVHNKHYVEFQDPLHPGDRVILVHSLVSGGMAERDSRLRVGDKVVSVNNISVVNHSLQVRDSCHGSHIIALLPCTTELIV